MAHRKSLNRTAKQRRIAHFLSQPLQAAAPGQSATPTPAQKADLESRTVGRVVFPWDPDYDQDRQETNPAFQYYPLVIVYCACETDVLVSMAELTAVGIYVQYWWPDFPTWATAAIFFVVINLINLTQVKVYGEMEFWFALVKVVAIVSMIGFGAWLLGSGHGGPDASVANLWQYGGFFPNGVTGLVMALAVIMFSFGGLELVGITAAEADNPRESIPKATNQVVYRILIFYIGALAVLLSLYPWQKVVQGGSPFVMIFHELDSDLVATILNIVVLTAALSVYNSCVYANSRMLFGLASQGDAPRQLLKVSRSGVPLTALAVSAFATGLCVLINYLMPGGAFGLLMALAVSALVINWASISITHLKFRKAKLAAGITPFYKSLGHPLTNYLCLAFIVLILVVMYLTPPIRISVMLIPAWIAVLWVAFKLKKARQAKG